MVAESHGLAPRLARMMAGGLPWGGQEAPPPTAPPAAEPPPERADDVAELRREIEALKRAMKGEDS